jgi:hypothetical protein
MRGVSMNGTENWDRGYLLYKQQVTWLEIGRCEDAHSASGFPWIDQRARKRPCRFFLSRRCRYEISNTYAASTEYKRTVNHDTSEPCS